MTPWCAHNIIWIGALGEHRFGVTFGPAARKALSLWALDQLPLLKMGLLSPLQKLGYK